jgi:hypothetical protein
VFPCVEDPSNNMGRHCVKHRFVATQVSTSVNIDTTQVSKPTTLTHLTRQPGFFAAHHSLRQWNTPRTSRYRLSPATIAEASTDILSPAVHSIPSKLGKTLFGWELQTRDSVAVRFLSPGWSVDFLVLCSALINDFGTLMLPNIWQGRPALWPVTDRWCDLHAAPHLHTWRMGAPHTCSTTRMDEEGREICGLLANMRSGYPVICAGLYPIFISTEPIHMRTTMQGLFAP